MKNQEKKYMFVCNGGINRSPTGARVAREMAEERNVKLKTDYLALFPEESEKYEKKNKRKLQNADRVFVMTGKMVEIVRERYGVSGEKVINLNIRDNYNCYGLAGPQMRSMLELVLREKLEDWVR